MKKGMGKLVAAVISLMLVLGTAVPTFANELPDEGQSKGGDPITVGGIGGGTKLKFEGEDGQTYTAFCLNRSGGTPGSNVEYKEVSKNDLTVKEFDEEILKTLLNYPIIGNTKDFPATNSDEGKSIVTNMEDLDYYFRQRFIWEYQSSIDDTSGTWLPTTGSTDTEQQIVDEMRSFYDKAVAKEITLPETNDISVTTPEDKNLVYNEETGCYETGIYKVDSIGVLTNNITVKDMDLPKYMNVYSNIEDSEEVEEEVVDREDGTAALSKGSEIKVGDNVNEFYASITKEEFDKLPVVKEKVEVNGKITVQSTYVEADYKLYKASDGLGRQDLGVIVKADQMVEKGVDIKATKSVPKEKEDDDANKKNEERPEKFTPEKTPDDGDDVTKTPGSSKTGDESNAGVWLAVMAVSALGAGIIIKKKGII